MVDIERGQGVGVGDILGWGGGSKYKCSTKLVAKYWRMGGGGIRGSMSKSRKGSSWKDCVRVQEGKGLEGVCKDYWRRVTG